MFTTTKLALLTALTSAATNLAAPGLPGTSHTPVHHPPDNATTAAIPIPYPIRIHDNMQHCGYVYNVSNLESNSVANGIWEAIWEVGLGTDKNPYPTDKERTKYNQPQQLSNGLWAITYCLNWGTLQKNYRTKNPPLQQGWISIVVHDVTGQLPENDEQTGWAGMVTEFNKGMTYGRQPTDPLESLLGGDEKAVEKEEKSARGDNLALTEGSDIVAPKNEIHDGEENDLLSGEIVAPKDTIHGDNPDLVLDDDVAAPNNTIYDGDNQDQLDGKVVAPHDTIHGGNLDGFGPIVVSKNVEHSDVTELDGEVITPKDVKHGDHATELAGKVSPPKNDRHGDENELDGKVKKPKNIIHWWFW